MIFETLLPASCPPSCPAKELPASPPCCCAAPATLPWCPVVLGSPAVARPGLSPLSPGPSHPGDCPGQSQLLARSHVRGAAVPQHPCWAQGRGLLAAGHILVPTPCQELPGAHLPGALLGVPPSPSCAPRAPMGVPSRPHVLEQELCPGQGGLPAASGHGIWGIFHRLRPLLTCWKRVCCALWTAPLSHSTRRPSRYLVPKVPSGHQSPTEPIIPSWAPP